jgi:transcription antitermination factor NusG
MRRATAAVAAVFLVGLMAQPEAAPASGSAELAEDEQPQAPQGTGTEATADPALDDEIPFRVGQVVEVTEGTFRGMTGTVQEVHQDKGTVKVDVSVFGRPTAVELDYRQLK